MEIKYKIKHLFLIYSEYLYMYIYIYLKLIYHYLYCRSLIDSIGNTCTRQGNNIQNNKVFKNVFKFILYFYHFDSNSLKLWIPMESMIHLSTDNLYNL